MSENRLHINIDDRLVGYIWVDKESETYKFKYSQEWKKDGFPISPHIQLDKNINSGTIRRFLENLIPEGKGLEDLTQFAHISKNNTFAIIKAIGYDTSGALMFGEANSKRETTFRAISKEELSQRIDNIDKQSITIWDKKERLSLAGVQEKLPVIIKNGVIGLGDGQLCSTHIMKFQTKRYANIVINELFCMKLAKKINLKVAEVELHRFIEHPVLMIKRFDRVYKNDKVERLHVIDACQMLDLSSSYKYERNFGSNRDVKHIREGASFSKLFKSANLCEVPAVAKLEILNWSIYNLIIGNCDAHAKNFSFFVDIVGIRPTPFYDLLCILAHEDIEHEMAFAYGDEFDPSKIKAYELRAFAEDIGVNFKLVSQTIDRLSKAIIKALDNEIVDIDMLNKNEIVFIDRLKKLILQRTVDLQESASEMAFITY